MKVKKVWECECGASKILMPAIKKATDLIVKGDAFHSQESVSHASRIICRQCSDKYEVVGPIVLLNIAKRLWECNCGNSSAIRNSKGAILLRGDAFPYGSPTTHAKCHNCGESHRIAFSIVWASQLAQKRKKRARSKANRTAERKRQK